VRAMKDVTALVAALMVCGACATVPAPPAGMYAAPDSAGTVWGDEYEEQYAEFEEPVARARGVSAEWVDGATRSTRLDAFSSGARVRLRRSRSGDFGAVSWQGSGVLREATAGHVTPSVAEGALVGDSRTSADLRAPTWTHAQGLRVEASSSPWSAMRGAGVVIAPGNFRVGLGACETRGAARRAGFASIDRSAGGITVGMAGGAMLEREISHRGGSVYVAHQSDASFACGEVALNSSGGVRTVARLVAGERREWSAIAIAGAGPAREEPLVFARRERWGAALERRDGWGWGACRTGLSSLSRRDADTDIHRRRAFWDGVWRLSSEARFELAARVTRESSLRAAGGAIASLPEEQTYDDWRARVTLRTGGAAEAGPLVENAYRLEWVQNRSGRPGTVATWTGRVRSGAIDGRLSATAHALHQDQVAYEPDVAPLSAGYYTVVAGKGATLSASLRVSLGAHAWLGAAVSKRPPGEPRLWISAGFKT